MARVTLILRCAGAEVSRDTEVDLPIPGNGRPDLPPDLLRRLVNAPDSKFLEQVAAAYFKGMLSGLMTVLYGRAPEIPEAAP